MEPKPLRERKWVHIVCVLMVFICTGTTTARIGSLLVEWMGIERFSWQYWVLFTIGLLPIYNLLLLPFAWLFGKFTYFREKQKRTWRFFLRIFGQKP